MLIILAWKQKKYFTYDYCIDNSRHRRLACRNIYHWAVCRGLGKKSDDKDEFYVRLSYCMEFHRIFLLLWCIACLIGAVRNAKSRRYSTDTKKSKHNQLRLFHSTTSSLALIPVRTGSSAENRRPCYRSCASLKALDSAPCGTTWGPRRPRADPAVNWWISITHPSFQSAVGARTTTAGMNSLIPCSVLAAERSTRNIAGGPWRLRTHLAIRCRTAAPATIPKNCLSVGGKVEVMISKISCVLICFWDMIIP